VPAASPLAVAPFLWLFPNLLTFPGRSERRHGRESCRGWPTDLLAAICGRRRAAGSWATAEPSCTTPDDARGQPRRAAIFSSDARTNISASSIALVVAGSATPSKPSSAATALILRDGLMRHAAGSVGSRHYDGVSNDWTGDSRAIRADQARPSARPPPFPAPSASGSTNATHGGGNGARRGAPNAANRPRRRSPTRRQPRNRPGSQADTTTCDASVLGTR
jgi:hypothetical protein